ncbi:unnamed protein product [Ceutorhynchus assimilis]|uniref:Uncharacterized protein n=1 Tax=Ceutorhynchus assimilis TaxID=467358 RepID=A0A9N9MBZ2_9CUCU|nr:unnamed protein product [Ceutorhynchus assimilis]
MESCKDSPKELDIQKNNNPNYLLEEIEYTSPTDQAKIHVALPEDSPENEPEELENQSSIDAAEIHAEHEEIAELATNYQNAIGGINNACAYLNEEIEPRLIQGSSSATLYLGKEAGTLLGSLKTMSEKLLKKNFNYEGIERNLGKARFDMSRRSQQLESLTAILEHNLESLQSVMEYCSRDSEESVERIQTPQKNYSTNTASDISSFKSTDIVTSSPFNSFDRIDEGPY